MTACVDIMYRWCTECMDSLLDASLKMDDNVELPCCSMTAYAIEIKQRFNWSVAGSCCFVADCPPVPVLTFAMVWVFCLVVSCFILKVCPHVSCFCLSLFPFFLFHPLFLFTCVPFVNWSLLFVSLIVLQSPCQSCVSCVHHVPCVPAWVQSASFVCAYVVFVFSVLFWDLPPFKHLITKNECSEITIK